MFGADRDRDDPLVVRSKPVVIQDERLVSPFKRSSLQSGSPRISGLHESSEFVTPRLLGRLTDLIMGFIGEQSSPFLIRSHLSFLVTIPHAHLLERRA